MMMNPPVDPVIPNTTVRRGIISAANHTNIDHTNPRERRRASEVGDENNHLSIVSSDGYTIMGFEQTITTVYAAFTNETKGSSTSEKFARMLSRIVGPNAKYPKRPTM